MTAIHDALRRDLDELLHTTASRKAARDRWIVFRDQLHFHLAAEHSAMWPPARARLAGDIMSQRELGAITRAIRGGHGTRHAALTIPWALAHASPDVCTQVLTGQNAGVWGGTSEEERQEIRSARTAAGTPPTEGQRRGGYTLRRPGRGGGIGAAAAGSPADH